MREATLNAVMYLQSIQQPPAKWFHSGPSKAAWHGRTYLLIVWADEITKLWCADARKWDTIGMTPLNNTATVCWRDGQNGRAASAESWWLNGCRNRNELPPRWTRIPITQMFYTLHADGILIRERHYKNRRMPTTLIEQRSKIRSVFPTLL